MGNVRLSCADNNEDGAVDVNEIIEESNYYPFGMQHIGYNGGTLSSNLGQKIKYQGQERQDELGLNWDSFKWRNYDYAIGRFMSVDPLAEKYVYNSPYAFQENKLGMGLELEGLEMVSERSKDGKSITLTITVRPVNNTGKNDAKAGTHQVLSDSHFRTLVDSRKAQTIKSFNGKTSDGVTVTTKIVESDEATLTWEYNTMLHGKGVKGNGQRARGHADEIGNTQVNSDEINVVAIFGQDAEGNLNFSTDKIQEASQVGAHEDGHMGGLEHPQNIMGNLGLKQEVFKDFYNNLMNEKGEGTNLTKGQRSLIINTVEQQQPKL